MYTQYYTIFNIHIPAIKGYNNIIHNFEQYIVFVLFCENDQKMVELYYQKCNFEA